MTGFDAYVKYLAVATHFKSPGYDFFKYQGKVKTSKDKFETRRDRYFFAKAARKYSDDDWLKILVANAIADESGWVGNLVNGGLDNISPWQKKIESLTYLYKEDLKSLQENFPIFDDLLAVRPNEHPKLFKAYSGGHVSLETVTILDALTKYGVAWKRQQILDQVAITAEKYRPFLFYFTRPDLNKFKTLTLEIYHG